MISQDRKIELIQELIDSLEKLEYKHEYDLNALRKRADMIVKNLFGDASEYRHELGNISFWRMGGDFYHGGIHQVDSPEYWETGKIRMRNIFNTMLEEIQIFDMASQLSGSGELQANTTGNRIFIVHGHDEEMKQAVARILEQLHLEPVIMQEEADLNRPTIQKFIDLSVSACFAIVLLSPDDLAYSKRDKAQNSKTKLAPRARQNVILELGYFIGKLGMNNVFALRKEDKDWDVPSDYLGVLYTPFDKPDGSWRLKLVNELKARGFKVSADDLQ